MKKLILLIAILISENAYGTAFIGWNEGKHLIAEGLNDSHPMVGAETDDRLGVVAYLNSYEQLGVGIYDTYTVKAFGNFQWSLKLGVTTGYSPIMKYKGQQYMVNEKAFLTSDIMLLAVGALEYNLKHDRISIEMLGDSIGISFRHFFGKNTDKKGRR